MRPVHPTPHIPSRRLTKLSNWSASCRTSLSQLQRLKKSRETTSTTNQINHQNQDHANHDNVPITTNDTKGDRKHDDDDNDSITTSSTTTTTPSSKRTTREQSQNFEATTRPVVSTKFRIRRFLPPTDTSPDISTHTTPVGTTHTTNDENMPKTPHRRNNSKKKKSTGASAVKKKKSSMLRSLDTNAGIGSHPIKGRSTGSSRSSSDETTRDSSYDTIDDVSKTLYETELLHREEATTGDSTTEMPTVKRILEDIVDALEENLGDSVIVNTTEETVNTTGEMANVFPDEISSKFDNLQPVPEETADESLTESSISAPVVTSEQSTVNEAPKSIMVEEKNSAEHVVSSGEDTTSGKEVDVLPVAQSIYGTAKNVWSFATHVPLLNLGLGLTHFTAEKAVGIVGQELESVDREIETKMAELDYHLSKFIGR